MKNLFFGGVLLFLVFWSCRNSDDSVQQIDQVMNLYIDSLGKDMLNSKISGSYYSVTMNDVLGSKDYAPVTVNIKKNTDTIAYLEYVAGAKRLLIDSINPDNKKYASVIALAMTKKVAGSNTTKTTKDTMRIIYSSTPQQFEISSLYYNNVLVFSKTSGQPNIIKIVK